MNDERADAPKSIISRVASVIRDVTIIVVAGFYVGGFVYRTAYLEQFGEPRLTDDSLTQLLVYPALALTHSPWWLTLLTLVILLLPVFGLSAVWEIGTDMVLRADDVDDTLRSRLVFFATLGGLVGAGVILFALMFSMPLGLFRMAGETTAQGIITLPEGVSKNAGVGFVFVDDSVRKRMPAEFNKVNDDRNLVIVSENSDSYNAAALRPIPYPSPHPGATPDVFAFIVATPPPVTRLYLVSKKQVALVIQNIRR